MTPTNKLRFVERLKVLYEDPKTGVKNGSTIRILQQWWEHTEWNAEGEWRDVLVEKEE